MNIRGIEYNFHGEEEKRLIRLIDLNNLPIHIAVIMDGNGRWAQSKNLNRSEGHKAGVKSIHGAS